MRPLNRLAIFAIRGYQRLTRNRAHRCLHYPTCSHYGLLAYEALPFLSATRKTLHRIRLCNPFSTLPYEDYP